jgi:TolB-like protein
VVDLPEPAQLEQLRAALGDRYDIEHPVGEGGMATVYLARDLRHGRKVAVKALRSDLATSVGADRFLREIRVAANLQHPHILPFYDSGNCAGLLYYVMPFVDGESLRRHLEREPQLLLPLALRIVREAADALAYAHAQGIVHRDIKPENILLQNGHALVADFGIAQAVDVAIGDKLTVPGLAIGTPHYMSPEQGAGEPHLDGRTDVYSLGCVLYEMLAGDPPFQGRTATTILARHTLEQVPALRVVRQALPEEVEDVVLRALAKSPADRLEMSEFAAVLAELESRIALGRIGTGVHSAAARREARSHRRALAAAGALALAALGWFTLRPQVRSPTATAGFDPRHIAVLYFDRRGGQDSLAYLADGITEELIRELSRVPALRIISRNGVSPYRNTTVAPDSIARALNVGTLVHGTVSQDASRLRLDVSLIDGATGTEIGSTTIERSPQEIFAVQDDLAEQVSFFLRRRLGDELKKQAAESRREGHDPRAWRLLQQAEELQKDVDPLLLAGDSSGAAGRLRRADSLLGQAERLEPSWARAVVARGWIAFRQLDLAGRFDRRYYDTWTARGLRHAERALQLDPELPAALELRGALRYYRWILNLSSASQDPAQLLRDAQADLEAAVAADPTAAFAWTLLSHLLLGQSQTAQSKLAALRAYQADPYLSSARQTLWRLFQSSLDLEDASEAKRWCQEGRRRFPEYYRFAECQIWLYALKDQPPDIDRAWQHYREYLGLIPPNARQFHEHYGQMLVAVALARAGLKDSADQVAVRARADSTLDETRELPQVEAVVRTLLGDRDGALRQLSIYLAANPHLRPGMAREQTWWFRELRQDPRYQQLVTAP